MSEVQSLLRLCITETASMIKLGYWPDACEKEFYEENPFSALPSDVVEELVSAVIQMPPIGSLLVSDLYPLLTSCRIKNFKLEDLVLATDQLVGILMSLSISGKYITSIILRDVYCSDTYLKDEISENIFLKSSALDCLVTMCPFLETLESSVEFHLTALQKATALKRLKLNFVPKCSLYHMFLEIDDDIIPNESLTHFYVFEDHRNPVDVMEIVFILKYCNNLVCIENDIAESLWYLHEVELFKGSLRKEYKLEKCILGSAYSRCIHATASVESVHIATVTCPSLKELDVLLNDHNAIYALSDFKNLMSLLIQWDLVNGGDFRLGLQLLLEKIGDKLKTLMILNFGYIDFYAIASLCPLLEVLKVEFDNETRGYDAPEMCLVNLKSLHLECTDGNGASVETLISLLSDCKELTLLNINGMSFLNDDVMRKIFSKNHFSELKDLTIADCTIKDEGLKQIAHNCQKLEIFCFHSMDFLFEEATEIVHEINPRIIMHSDQMI